MKTKLFLLLAFLCQLTFAQISDQGLIAYYPFNNNTQNEVPNGGAYNLLSYGSGADYNLVHNGGVTGGAINNSNAYQFNNGKSLMATNFFGLLESNSNQNFSVSYWVSYNNPIPSFGAVNTQIEAFSSLFVRGTISFGVNTSSTGSGGFNLGGSSSTHNTFAQVWNHIAIVFNATEQTLTVYRNGSVFGSSISTSGNTIYKYNNRFVIGGGSNADGTANSSKSFSGKIDEVYVFNRALQPSEVTALYDKQVPTTICPTGNVTLTSQAEVDAFVTQYPNCTEIDGNLSISGTATNNLTALNNITAINGQLSINGTNITNGNIFNNLTSVTGMINIQSNPVLSDLSGFNALVSTPNTIQVNNNQSLTQISGFNALTTVGQNLSVIGALVNPLPLNSISGFSNVQSVGYLLIRNTALTNLSQLSSLQSINFGLSIDNNPLLTSIAALSNCTNAMNGNGTSPFRIFENHALVSLNGINFSSVTNSSVVKISGLHLVETINELSSLQGNFPEVDVSVMPVLQNLNGFSNITGIGKLILNNNPLIASLPSWNLTQLEHLSISNMPSLTSIATLSGVTSMGNATDINAIVFNQNTQLSNLTGLHNLTNLNNKNVFLRNNTNLTDINALNGLTISTLGGFTFIGNTNLATCAVDWVCNRLALNTNNISILTNATGCESIAVVQAACAALSSSDFELESNLKIYPNPFNSQITFDLGSSYENISVVILDITGKQLYQNSFSGNQLVINNLGNLPSGVYVATLTTENGTSTTKKLIK